MINRLCNITKKRFRIMNGSPLVRTAFDIKKPSIKLNHVEQKICKMLNDYTSIYNLNQKGLPEPLILRISGGWVRDKLLGRESHDLDIAINIMSGEQFAMQLNKFLVDNYEEYGLEPHSIHKIDINPEKSKHLETATTKLYNIEVDFVNLRSEEYSDHSRIPVVKFGTAEEDALRRDATLNALFYNITEDRIEDFTKLGLQDLHDGILRTPLPPKQTFLDDPLRVIRLVRFAARYNFKIDPKVFDEMKDPEINDAFSHKISSERIGIEVQKILNGPNPLLGISLIQKTGIDNVVFHWHDDDEIISFNKSHLSEYESIEQIYKSGQLNQHLEKVVDNFPLFFSKDLTYYHDQSTAACDFKMNLILSCCIIPSAHFKIYWTTRAKLNNMVSLSESILKNWLKIGKSESARIGKVIESLDSYDEKVNKIAKCLETNTCVKRSDIGIFLKDLKGDWEMVHYVSLFNHFLYSSDYSAIQKNYQMFHSYVYDQQLEDAHKIRPLLNGKETLKELNMKAGPWLGKINDQAIHWQFDNPTKTKGELLDYLKSILNQYV